ncbi:MAG: hypothetical protein KDD25_05860, partial [Bdellovibrionales bacterium]|nr:hypothetical protein [Bdellovibrionales bacterium]
RNVTFVAGGKYTTYRLIAEQVVDACLTHLPFETVAKLRSSNTRVPINSYQTPAQYQKAKTLVDVWESHSNLSKEAIVSLIEKYGLEIQKYIFDSDVVEEVDVDILYAIDNTMCVGLLDFYLRRTHLLLAEKGNSLDKAEYVAKRMANYLEWDEARVKKEIEKLLAHVKSEMAWRK